MREGVRVLLVIDGLHTQELLGSLARTSPLTEAELWLVYVRGPGARAGLEMVRRRPGGGPLPPGRERGLDEAESARAAESLGEAEVLARPLAAAVRTMQLDGEPGRVVCDLARAEGIDLVAIRVGGKDQPPLGPRSLGPAARYIADHSPCPVLLIR